MTDARGGAFYDAAAAQALQLGAQSVFSPNHVMEEPAVLAELGDPAGLRVLDLGCGNAGFGGWLLANGSASYLGVDGSARMTRQARATLAATAGRVEHADLETYVGQPQSADVVTARLCLHYVEDIAPVLSAAAAALVPGGRLIITVVHPVITSRDNPSTEPRTSWTVDDYFMPGARTKPWLGAEVTWYHRTVEHYVSAVLATGLALTAVRECHPVPERFAGNAAELARRRRVPLFLLISARARAV